MDSEKDIKKATKRLVKDNGWDKARALSYHIIPIALASGLIFLMLACASNFLAVQQHIVKAQSTPRAANPKGCVPACGAPGTLPTNTTGTQNPMNFTAPTGAPGNPLANTTVTQHLPNFNPPITQHCGNKYTSCG